MPAMTRYLDHWATSAHKSIITARLTMKNFKANRRLFGDGPRNFEPWSSDEDVIWSGTPSPNFHTTQTKSCVLRGVALLVVQMKAVVPTRRSDKLDPDVFEERTLLYNAAS
ncbi:hypothetical protein TNCV_1013291 [Trichonephila clavipes]|uniref:Uncharacterized protein n=1 Tax=Trichonephila clavipes TaxID=2585209 RepID=A0A8X6VXL5_TRICX|nr:hypothetical protein TNCV_1013291 [Trichonephila clavipes]